MKPKGYGLRLIYSDFNKTVDAALYDLVQTANGVSLSEYMALLKTVKPTLKAIGYWNMRSMSSTTKEAWDYVTTNHPEWFLKDETGQYVACDVGYLLDIGNTQYQTWIAAYVASQISQLGFDGLMADNSLFSGAGEAAWGSTPTGAIINPRTGQAWTDTEVNYAQATLHNALKATLGSKILVCNGIWSGYRYYQKQSNYDYLLGLSNLDGIMSEGLYNPTGLGPEEAGTPSWMTETQWLQTLEFVKHIQEDWLLGHANRVFAAICKLAIWNLQPMKLPSGATPEQMAVLGYCSLMLGLKPETADQVYYGTFAESAFVNATLKPLFDVNIGEPVGEAYVVAETHVYERDFENGKVLVNPTDTPYAIEEGTMSPHTGAIIVGSLKADFTFSTPYDGTPVKLTLGD